MSLPKQHGASGSEALQALVDGFLADVVMWRLEYQISPRTTSFRILRLMSRSQWDWPFGNVYCSISNFIANVTVAASVFTLTAISADRCMAIVRPLRPRISKKCMGASIAGIWMASGLLAIPCLIYSRTIQFTYANNETRTMCYMEWPDGNPPSSYQDYVYNVVFLIVTYVVPGIAMSIFYGLIGMELCWSKTIGELTQRQLQNIQSKKKVVKMFLVIVLIFAVCWLPYHAHFLYAYHNQEVAKSTSVVHVYFVFYWLAMSNAMINPIVYYFMNAKYSLDVHYHFHLRGSQSIASH
ncbi:unnamed protein product [Darwinula stevensoni]|uniref:G-protein coupled receptors family 1 profile domain-containing protein n=1 Tax=Darwinula stevensoni TaxID=69355 RepID=A0A7R8X3W3_9CRUS|nr:unnamed protein product [Darwinula stevensoni]CAG0878539.1 unnamed protein product [Darwinula stevensoni]